jgi:hypothetical protein
VTTATLSQTITIGPGTRRDYGELAGLHYRAGPPATIALREDGAPCILAARDGEGRLAGVLVVSMPTLNGSWRRLAWPGAYGGADKRRNARELNASLRCISRVIVGARFRGLGIATRLVRAYLAGPLTPRTEAVAAMGRVCPFFEAAGMTPYPLAPSARDARLLDALASLSLEPWEVLAPGAASGAIARAPWLAREARIWANGSRASRRHLNAEPARLLTLAALHGAEQPIAYAHGG